MITQQLQKIKQRYFRKKEIRHHGDCSIYRNEKKFCSCGLLHDLCPLDRDIIKIIYPEYDEEFFIQECQKDFKVIYNEKEIENARKILESIFGPIPPLTLLDVKKRYKFLKSLLNTVFEDKFPAAKKKLKEWFEDEISQASSS